ncbi:MAG: hypothetical protein JSS10_03080 [Verrucomicrobia bacterium]|nr:hypothetical protein [Verrucomicrobiota bacterium]
MKIALIKKWIHNLCCLLYFSLTPLCNAEITASNNQSQNQAFLELQQQFNLHHERPSDINEHLPTLRRLAKECSSVVELGVRNIVSTWGLLIGLAENQYPNRTYIGVDLGLPTPEIFSLVKRLATTNRISYQHIQANDMYIDIKETDLLFIDTLHIYAHLTYELEKFSPKIRKYIAIHDTSDTFEYRDCTSYQGDYSEYPFYLNREKAGLWTAVVDFLARHPEWTLYERHTNNNGLTVLKRKI